MMERETKVGSGGFVRYIDHMGSDEKLVRTARVSTGRGFVSWDPYQRCKGCNRITRLEDGLIIQVGDDTCEVTEENPTAHKWEKFPIGDNGIIHHMVENRHTSPIEFGEIIFHLRIPMDIWRQVVRHRTANVSEYSTRYSPAIDEMSVTDPAEWRLQATENRQGSSGYLEKGTSDDKLGYYLSMRERELHKFAREVYEERLELGVAKEQARKDLPLSNYTEVYWKMDCHNLMHFLGLRLDQHAQLEARQFGAGIASIMKELFPRLWEAFEEYKLYSVTFSRTEMVLLRRMVQAIADLPVEGFEELRSKRAQQNFLKKLGLI